MSHADGSPASLRSGPSQDSLVVQGIQLAWQAQAGTCTFEGLPVAMMWVDSTLAGLMAGLATMVGPERFALALQSEGRKSVAADWHVISRYPDFRDGFRAIGTIAAVAGWGEWQLLAQDTGARECRFRARNTWEGLYQRKLGVCWESAMLAGKFAGYCTNLFGTNCWATQTAFIARGDPCDEFVVSPSPRVVEDEIARLLSTDQATRADLAVALTRLREVQAQLLVNQETLEQDVRRRTGELAASRDQMQVVNDLLRAEVDGHRQTAHARQQGEELLRRIIELAPMSIAVVGMDGRIEYINQKAIETFGYRPADIPDMAHWWLAAYPDPAYREEACAKWMGHVATAMAAGGEIQRDHYRITCKDGSVKTVAVFGMPVAGKVLVIFDDITIQTLREDLLRRSHADLEQRVQERTTELAERNLLLQAEVVERGLAEDRLMQANLALERTMSQLRKLGAKLSHVEEQERKRMAHVLHDQLQQALVAARFSLSVLEQHAGAALQDTVAAARAAVEEALRESKSLVLELSPPVLRENGIAPAMKWLRHRMQDKHGLSVALQIDPAADMLEEDLRLAIFHAVRELLLNVAKYAGVASAEVSIGLLPDAKVQVCVADRGCGFDPSEAARSESMNAGFGLLAVRERFDALGGHLRIESTPGRGCRVTLTAPITAQTAATVVEPAGHGEPPSRADAAGVADRHGAPSASNRIRVLLADDHQMVRQGLVQLLSQDSAIEVVGEAADGAIAVACARSLRPDVILMDIGMPRMDGIAATQAIHAEFPEIRIIGLSMHAEAERGAAMRRAGACGYVSKSEAAGVLAATIRACYRQCMPDTAAAAEGTPPC